MRETLYRRHRRYPLGSNPRDLNAYSDSLRQAQRVLSFVVPEATD